MIPPPHDPGTYPMKNQLFIFLALALGAFALLPGCSSRTEDQFGLQVQLVKLERKADGSLLASLLFSNPNVGPLNLARSKHQLTLDGKPAGDLEVVEPIGLPALQSATATVTLKRANGAAEVSGHVSYQLNSLVTLRIYEDTIKSYKTSSSGTVTVE
jgi:hypothetical protein